MQQQQKSNRNSFSHGNLIKTCEYTHSHSISLKFHFEWEYAFFAAAAKYATLFKCSAAANKVKKVCTNLRRQTALCNTVHTYTYTRTHTYTRTLFDAATNWQLDQTSRQIEQHFMNNMNEIQTSQQNDFKRIHGEGRGGKGRKRGMILIEVRCIHAIF